MNMDQELDADLRAALWPRALRAALQPRDLCGAAGGPCEVPCERPADVEG